MAGWLAVFAGQEASAGWLVARFAGQEASAGWLVARFAAQEASAGRFGAFAARGASVARLPPPPPPNLRLWALQGHYRALQRRCGAFCWGVGVSGRALGYALGHALRLCLGLGHGLQHALHHALRLCLGLGHGLQHALHHALRLCFGLGHGLQHALHHALRLCLGLGHGLQHALGHALRLCLGLGHGLQHALGHGLGLSALLGRGLGYALRRGWRLCLGLGHGLQHALRRALRLGLGLGLVLGLSGGLGAVYADHLVTDLALTGTAREDQRLTIAGSGFDDGHSPAGALVYEWARSSDGDGDDFAVIAGATERRYQLTQADVGRRVRGSVLYTNTDGTANSRVAGISAPVANVNDPTTGLPVITGDHIQGETLTADTSAIMDEDGLGTFTYRWLRNGQLPPVSTERTYTLTQADVGAIMFLDVFHTDAQGTIQQTSLFSSFPRITNINDLPTGLAISGGLLVGQTLRADTSALVDIDGLPAESEFSYQWLADDANIANATEPEYLLTAAQIGAQISLNLQYQDAFGADESITSPARGPVRGAGDNAAPTSSGLTVTTDEDTPYTFGAADFPFSDGDTGDSLQAVRIDSLPAPANLGELTLNGAALSAGQEIAVGDIGTLVFTPALNASGDVSFTYSVSDGDEFSATANAAITIAAVNDPPTISGSPQTRVSAGGTYNFTPGGGDVDDGDTLEYAINTLPDWADFSTTSGALTNKTNRPDSDDIGNYPNIVISVTDGIIAAPVTLPAFAIEVTAPNNPPTTSTFTIDIDEDATYTFSVADFPFLDEDAGDSLQAVRINRLPLGTGGSLALDGVAVVANQVIEVGDIGTLVFTPVANTSSVPDENVTGSRFASASYQVSDGKDFSTTHGINFRVTSVNDLPTITGSPATRVSTGSTYNFTPGGGDADGNTLLYDISGRPNWADFSNTTGALTNKTNRPDSDDIGNYPNIVISVTDGIIAAPVTLPAFAIEVTAPNNPPTTSTFTIDIDEDATYTFSVADFPFLDEDAGDSLQAVRINRLPLGTGGSLALDGVAVVANQVIEVGDIGTLVFTPVANTSSVPDENVTGSRFASASYQVSDGKDFSTTHGINFRVTAVNDLPTITGSPATRVSTGSTYNFTPGGGDADGNTLVYDIRNRPNWADFSNTTGALTNKTNRPDSDDIGNYEDIVISVTDGIIAAPVTLPAFAIEVTAPNNPPTTSGLRVTTAEDTPYTFREADFPFSDLDAGDSLQAVRIDTLPDSDDGSLALGGTAVSVPQVIAVGDIGTLVYTPVANVNGTATFTFSVSDGTAFSAPPATATLTVDAVNDAPSGTVIIDGTPTVGETLTANTSGISDADGPASLTFTYQWNTHAGGTDTAISGETAATYLLTADEVGDQITVSVRYTDAGGTNEGPLTSVPTVEIGDPAPVVISIAGPSAPVIEGDPATFTVTLSASSGSEVVVNYAASGDTAMANDFTAPASDAALTFAANASGTDLMQTISVPTTDDSDTEGDETFILTLSAPGGGFPSGVALDSSATSAQATIAASNVPPTASAGADQTVAEGATVTLNGSGNDPDGDNNALTYAWTQSSGTPRVSLSGANTAAPTFTAPADLLTDASLEFSLVVNDGTNDSATADTVTITITGVNDAPIANAGDDQTVAEGASVTLNGSASSDPEGEDLTYAWTQVGTPRVSLSGANTATPTFTAPTELLNPETLVFQLIVTEDRANGSASNPATVNVIVSAGTNDPPIANAGADQTVAEGASVTLNGSGSSDPEGENLTYAWTQVGTPMVSLSGANTATPTFTAPTELLNPETLVFQLIVTEDRTNGSASNPATVNVIVNAGTNDAPTADAGANQTVAEGASVTLNGSGSSDPESATLTYAWTQASGTPTVTLTGQGTAAPTFTAPRELLANAVLEFSLVVNDGVSDSQAATVTITVTGVNDPPIANAGADQNNIAEGASVTLNGSASSDPEGEDLTYAWTQVGTPRVSLSGANTATPTFTAPADLLTDASLEFSLVVNDGANASAAATVTITITGVNDPPTANAGADQTVAEGASVTLNGNGSSDPESANLTYAWTQVGTPRVTLNGANTATPTFTAPENLLTNAVLEFSLTVNDGVSDSQAATVTITVTGVNDPPTANAGADQTVDEGVTVTLDGSASSDPEGEDLTYAWTQVGTPRVALNGADTVTPTFTAPTELLNTATLVFQLIVTEDRTNGSASNPATVNVIVSAGTNDPPTANAGADQTVDEGVTVTLDGSASSDPESATLTYTWTQTSGTPTVTLIGQGTAAPTFTAPENLSANAVLVFSLTVNDGANASAAATVTITVTAVNNAPTADAGAGQTVAEGAPVTLNGSGNDPDGDNSALTYTWTQVGTPRVTLNGADTATPTFTAPADLLTDASLEFSLVVNDGTNDSAAATVTITVTAAPPDVLDADEAMALDMEPARTDSTGTTITLPTSEPVNIDNADVGDFTVTSILDAVETDHEVTRISTGSIILEVEPAIRARADDIEVFYTPARGSITSIATDMPLAGFSTNLPVDNKVVNSAPIANAGEDQSVTEGATVTLNGSASSDPEGEDLTYAWTQVGTPRVTLTGADTATPTFTAPENLSANAVLEFMLTVTDLGGAPGTDPVRISVTTDAPARQQALKTGLAALGRGLAASATDAIGQRLKPAATGPETSAFSGLSLADCIASLTPTDTASADTAGADRSAWFDPRDLGGDIGSAEPDKDSRNNGRNPLGACRLPDSGQLARSAFVIPLNRLNGNADAGAGGGYWSLWGRGDLSRFEGRPQTGLDLDGDLTAGYLGLDYRLSSGGLVGVALSRSEGEIDYRSGTTDGALDNGTFDEGTLDTRLNSVYPYGYWSPRAGMGLWGLLGVGSGDATLSHRETDFATDLDMRMGALGLRQVVQTLGSFELALKADAFVVELESEDVPGLPAVSAQARRARLLLEASHRWQPHPDERLGTSLELGARADGGDADEGAGAELGVGLEYSNTRLGLRAQWRAQGLLAHSASGFEEWGTSLNVELDPGVSGRGLALTLAPTWGQAASGGAQALWQSDRPLRDSGLASASAMRMDLNLSYGLNRDRRQLSPFASLGLADGVMQRLRLGLRLGLADELEMELFGGRNASENRSPEHLLGLTGRLRF